MQAVEVSDSTFIVELEGSIYPNRTQEESNSMKKHVNHLICIMTPWQYFVAHYGCRQITTAWSKMFSTPTQWTDHQGEKEKMGLV
jgi:hypothetical protein